MNNVGDWILEAWMGDGPYTYAEPPTRWKKKFVYFPRRCRDTGKILFLTKAWKEVLWPIPNPPSVWISDKAYVIRALKGEL